MAKNHIRFDWAAKKILRDKKNFDILEGFLSELLNEDIKIEGLLESESNQEEEDEKFNRVDLYAENSKGEHIIIEIQNTRELDYLMRMLFATSKVVTENLPIGEEYANIKLINMYFSNDQISVITELEMEEIEALRKTDPSV